MKSNGRRQKKIQKSKTNDVHTEYTLYVEFYEHILNNMKKISNTRNECERRARTHSETSTFTHIHTDRHTQKQMKHCNYTIATTFRFVSLLYRLFRFTTIYYTTIRIWCLCLCHCVYVCVRSHVCSSAPSYNVNTHEIHSHTFTITIRQTEKFYNFDKLAVKSKTFTSLAILVYSHSQFGDWTYIKTLSNHTHTHHHHLIWSQTCRRFAL